MKSIISRFRKLSEEEQDKLVSDLYHFSPGTKSLVDKRLGLTANFDYLVLRMKRETLDKVYPKGMGVPKTPNGKSVNNLISTAKKALAPIEVMLQLEQLAYRGFIEYLNQYGGGPESFEDMAASHLETYLKIVKVQVEGNRKEQIIGEIKKYLLKLNNMNTDYIYQIYEDVVGEKLP